MKADILSRKDHINTMEDNKETNNSRNRNDMRKNQIVEETTLLK